MIRINNDWEFVFRWSDGFGRGEGAGEPVRLPHTVKELPPHCADSACYETVSGYRRRLAIPGEAEGRRVFLQFDGAAHIATVYINGRELATHRCGYTAFRVELTGYVRCGGENLLAVKLDSTENPAVPPFGSLIDYLTCGGLYRDVWLDIRPQRLIHRLFVYTPDLTHACISCETEPEDGCRLRFEIFAPDGSLAACQTAAPGQTRLTLAVPDARAWSPETPALYRCRVTMTENGADGDAVETVFGFRTAVFQADGFYLNGEKVFLRGLNRHQSYPWLGYAAPEALQREDARILRHELQCNAVRTSHYPQSQYFLDECDRQGLLVFTELPGWQHIGDEAWQEQAVRNVREMVTQYRNHPSVILWGVRINESRDDDALYARTNAAAHELDPSRATSGVRDREMSRLLEDVYAYNDFSHTGDNPGVRPRETVCPDGDKALLVSECVGHMFPTKAFDPWQRRQEHALRHARVMDAAMADGGHAGVFGWCMFDYATHKDFGSGDRVCYHGVMDAFRNPKPAAAVYASQGEEAPVLEIGSPMDIGDYSACQIGEVYAFTNAQEVALYKNGDFVRKFRPKGWKGLKHGPILIDDTIGALLETKEGFGRAKADDLRVCLLAAGKYGYAQVPPEVRQEMARCLRRHGMSAAEARALFGKYVGNWGETATVWRFDALQDGKVAASVTKCPSAKLHLSVAVSHTDLTEGDTYDMAAVRIRVLDENGNPAPYAQLPVKLTLRGEAELACPDVAVLEGGSGGAYVRTAGRAGSAVLTVSTPQTQDAVVRFSITLKQSAAGV